MDIKKLQNSEWLKLAQQFVNNLLPKIIGYIMLISPIRFLFYDENQLFDFSALDLPNNYFIFIGIMALAAVYLIKR